MKLSPPIGGKAPGRLPVIVAKWPDFADRMGSMAWQARPIAETGAGADCCNIAKNTASPTKRVAAGPHRSAGAGNYVAPYRYDTTVCRYESARRAPHESKTRQ